MVSLLHQYILPRRQIVYIQSAARHTKQQEKVPWAGLWPGLVVSVKQESKQEIFDAH